MRNDEPDLDELEFSFDRTGLPSWIPRIPILHVPTRNSNSLLNECPQIAPLEQLDNLLDLLLAHSRSPVLLRLSFVDIVRLLLARLARDGVGSNRESVVFGPAEERHSQLYELRVDEVTLLQFEEERRALHRGHHSEMSDEFPKDDVVRSERSGGCGSRSECCECCSRRGGRRSGGRGNGGRSDEGRERGRGLLACQSGRSPRGGLDDDVDDGRGRLWSCDEQTGREAIDRVTSSSRFSSNSHRLSLSLSTRPPSTSTRPSVAGLSFHWLEIPFLRSEIVVVRSDETSTGSASWRYGRSGCACSRSCSCTILA